MHYFGRIETALSNPALETLASQMASELVVAQVLVKHNNGAWELRHIDDRLSRASELKPVGVGSLREIAQCTESGAFRPLKSAPNLRRGWITQTRNIMELGRAFDQLYPGFIADWFAAREKTAAPTNYRQFTNRQTGMYRIAQGLTDEQAAAAIRACCDTRFCLKQRLWTVAGQAADSSHSKCLIPCFEPCAVMLEFARIAARLEQSRPPESADAALKSPGDALAGFHSPVREADFNAPNNPRRLQLALEKTAASRNL